MGNYSFVVTSDPQYPWTDMTDKGQYETDSDKEKRSKELIENQYNSIKDYAKNNGNMIETIINGDITAYGHSWQWDMMNSLMKQLRANTGSPVVYGLGNHDIENNYDDTFHNDAWNRSFQYMYNQSNPSNKNFPELVQRDCNIEDHGIFGDYKYYGSLNFSQNIGNFRLIICNNYPTMTASTSYGRYVYWLKNGLKFIASELGRAARNKKPVILCIHKPDNWNWEIDKYHMFRNLVQTYYNAGILKAIYTGHYHRTHGDVTNRYEENFGSVPTFSSGSASQKSYLINEVDQQKGELKVYDVVDNAWKDKKLLKTININILRDDISCYGIPDDIFSVKHLGTNLYRIQLSLQDDWKNQYVQVYNDSKYLFSREKGSLYYAKKLGNYQYLDVNLQHGAMIKLVGIYDSNKVDLDVRLVNSKQGIICQ